MINVIIPAYNCSATIGRTLSSLVAQTDIDFEVIVVDDCSTEDIKAIIDDYKNKLNIIYIRNKENLGCGMSRQVGIDNATQKFITFLDSDDMFMPYTVETFNSIIATNPDTEYLHTYFYEQLIIDDSPALYLHEDNYTACHGKLYNVELVKELGIINSPQVKYADDAFFNSMCSELMNMSIIRIPTMIWVNNPDSILRRKDPIRDETMKNDFLNAMKLSTEFVYKKKGYITHLQDTIKAMQKRHNLEDKYLEQLNELMKFTKQGGNL